MEILGTEKGGGSDEYESSSLHLNDLHAEDGFGVFGTEFTEYTRVDAWSFATTDVDEATSSTAMDGSDDTIVLHHGNRRIIERSDGTAFH